VLALRVGFCRVNGRLSRPRVESARDGPLGVGPRQTSERTGTNVGRRTEAPFREIIARPIRARRSEGQHDGTRAASGHRTPSNFGLGRQWCLRMGVSRCNTSSRVASVRVLRNCGFILAVCWGEITSPRRRDLFRCSSVVVPTCRCCLATAVLILIDDDELISRANTPAVSVYDGDTIISWNVVQ
jgi:hypothetical protein